MGFHFTMLCGQIFVHMPKKKHFLNILPLSSSTSPANSAIRVSYRFGGSGSTRPSDRSIHIVGAASASSSSQYMEWKGWNLFTPLAGFVLAGLADTLWRAAPTPDSEKLLPVSASMGRATGSTWSWFRTFCRDESTSQSTVRALWTAFMQIVCRCLTGVFSLSVDDRSGLMTSRHSCAHHWAESEWVAIAAGECHSLTSLRWWTLAWESPIFSPFLEKSQFLRGSLLPPRTLEFTYFSKFRDFSNVSQFLEKPQKSQFSLGSLLPHWTLQLSNVSKF